MKFFYRGALLFALALLISCPTFARKKNAHCALPPAIQGTQNLVAVLNTIVQRADPKATIGMRVQSMENGEVLYSKNEGRLLVPASIMKLMIAEAALLYLGPDYKFPTTLLTDAKNFSYGALNGNVYFVETGDPSLTYDDLNDLMVALKAASIQEIKGNVYIDTSAYDDSEYGPGWVWDDKQYCYAAPISASIINKNCLTFKVLPAKTIGHLASIIKSPRYFYGHINNLVLTSNKKAHNCGGLQLSQAAEGLSVLGCIPKGNEGWGASTVIRDIKKYNQVMLQSLFRQYGIRVRGQVLIGDAPRNLQSIASHESKALSLLIYDMLKKSDNVIAGSLLKKMGEFYARQPGGWKNGGEAVKQILAEKAWVDPRQMSILDGSGLSPDNRVKPIQIMQVLNFAYHNEATNYEFLSALPIAGIDGTLKHRLSNVTRRVRAKTGTLCKSGVVSLAGYAMTREKEPIAFVIIVNGAPGQAWKYRDLEDRIVTALTNYSRRRGW